MMSSEQLERQTEQSRAEVELTIDELRARLTPGQIVDEILSYAKDGGRQFTSNLGRQVSNNPLPVVLIGAGLAWFLFGRDGNASMGNGYYQQQSRGMSAGDALHGAANGTRHAMHDARDAVGSAMGSVGDMAESAGAAVSGAAKSLSETASSTYHTASAKVSETTSKLANTASALEQKTMDAAHNLMAQAKDHPLILVGVGLALGAVLGAAFPSTEAENRLMGDTSDEVKRDIKDVASDQIDKAKQVAVDQLERTKDAAEQFVEDAVASNGNRADNTRAQQASY